MGVVALSVLGLMVAATSPIASAKAHVVAAGPGKQKAQKVKHHKVSNHDPTIYDSIIDPNPGNLPSVGFEATQGYQVGNLVHFGGTARTLNDVVVQMSSWACQTGAGATCLTTPGTTFNEPITLNIFQVGNGITPGALISSSTQTFAIPYRPSADPTDCSTAPDDGTQWFDTNVNPPTCFNGFLTNITFTLGHVLLPNSVVYGIAYNTSDYGVTPYTHATPCHTSGNNCGYDSLNVGFSNEGPSPSVGSDANNGTIYWDTTYAGFYCDGGTDGVGVFRNDSPGAGNGCWTVGATPNVAPYIIPAVQFNALVSPSPTITSAASVSVTAGTPFSFQVTTTGVPTPAVTKLGGKLPKGLVFTNGVGTATISGTALKTDTNKNYTITVQAKNARRSVARQRLTLTLTGGK
jgi:hypothetical protein